MRRMLIWSNTCAGSPGCSWPVPTTIYCRCAALPESPQALGRQLMAQQLDWMENNLVQAAQLHGWTLRKAPKDYAFMLLSALEGASFIGWALGPSTDPLAAFHYMLDNLA